MKTKCVTDYLSPDFEVIKLTLEGILCASEPKGFGIADMNIWDGEGTDWDWE